MELASCSSSVKKPPPIQRTMSDLSMRQISQKRSLIATSRRSAWRKVPENEMGTDPGSGWLASSHSSAIRRFGSNSAMRRMSGSSIRSRHSGQMVSGSESRDAWMRALVRSNSSRNAHGDIGFLWYFFFSI